VMIVIPGWGGRDDGEPVHVFSILSQMSRPEANSDCSESGKTGVK